MAAATCRQAAQSSSARCCAARTGAQFFLRLTNLKAKYAHRINEGQASCGHAAGPAERDGLTCRRARRIGLLELSSRKGQDLLRTRILGLGAAPGLLISLMLAAPASAGTG